MTERERDVCGVSVCMTVKEKERQTETAEKAV